MKNNRKSTQRKQVDIVILTSYKIDFKQLLEEIKSLHVEQYISRGYYNYKCVLNTGVSTFIKKRNRRKEDEKDQRRKIKKEGGTKGGGEGKEEKEEEDEKQN